MGQINKKTILNVLSSLTAEQSRKLILSLDKKTIEQKVINPESFSNRIDYRKALIEQKVQTANQQSYEAIAAFKTIGLNIKRNLLTETIEIEGTSLQLIEALQREDIRDVSFDDTLKLIKPISDGKN